jgi:hypothetical protein
MARNFSSVAAFHRQLELMAKELDGAGKRKITKAMAEHAQKAIPPVVRGDLGGDLKFSGWAPELVTEIKIGRDNAAIIHPTRSSAGPFTVAEVGRNQGNASGFAGPGVNRRTGMTSRTKSGGIRKQRARQTKRWNGYTKGKGTSSKAIAAMDKGLADVVEKEARRVMVKHVDVD